MRPVLPIIYIDEHYVAINKPHNLLVHRSAIAADQTAFALQILRDQLGLWVSPCHRIDRKTSGVLLFALSKAADTEAKKLFQTNKISKKYIALLRGYLPESGTTNRPLLSEKGKLQEATTHFKCIEQFELPIAVSRYSNSRYSLAEVSPETGRMHQIRRHFAQLRHYLIGDKTHGECKHNKMFEQNFGLDTMLLHAKELSFVHPFSKKEISILAEMNQQFVDILEKMRGYTIEDK